MSRNVTKDGTKRRRRRGSRGFTLTEVIVASMLFFVVTGGFLHAYLGAMRTQVVAADLYRATCIARNRIQRARALDFGSLPLLNEVDTAVDEQGNMEVGGAFRRTTFVTNTVPNCTRIHVSVYYPIPNGRLSPQPIEIQTLITQGI